MSKAIIWIIVAGLIFFLILMLIDSRAAGGGGDAATRGIGKTLNTMLIIAIISLVVLNLLPNDWSKYLGLFIGFVAVAIVVVFLLTMSGMLYQNTSSNNPQYQVSFDDPVLTEMYDAFKNGDVENWKKLLQKHPEHIHHKKLQNELLLMNYIDTQRLACIQYMIDSGAKIVTEFSSFIFDFARNSNVEMVDLFLQNGADPNTIEDQLNNWPVIYEAISGGYGDSRVVTIKLLIKHGADVNAKIYSNERQDTLTPLMFAAHREYWHSCIALLENGADPDFKNKDGISIKEMILEKAKIEKDQDHYPNFWEFVELLKK